MNVPEKLAREIGRVTTLRGQHAEAAKTAGPRANFGPALLMMDHALERAKLAAGLDDARTQIAALRDLEGFAE